jgi:MOSC domain-containing protein YiiM
MPSLAQRGLPPDPDVLRRLLARSGDHAGVLARVVEPGRIRRGDAVSVA